MSHTHRVNIVTEREELKQQKLTDIFISKSKVALPENSTQKDDRFILARRLSLWLSKDLLPFSLVENKGFTDFWTSLHLPESLPKRQTVSIGALDDMYSCIKTELIRILGKCPGEH